MRGRDWKSFAWPKPFSHRLRTASFLRLASTVHGSNPLLLPTSRLRAMIDRKPAKIIGVNKSGAASIRNTATDGPGQIHQIVSATNGAASPYAMKVRTEKSITA